MDKKLLFIKNFIIGILIGFGAILPGISSGVFCVIFGIYENLVEACSSLFKNFKKNFNYLFPIGIGALIGVFIFGNLIKFIFLKFENECKFVFIGLILGSIPALVLQTIGINKHNSKLVVLNKKNIFQLLLPMLISFVIGFSMTVLEQKINITTSTNSFIYLILCGFVMSAGVIIPGISNTLILMCLGIYSSYIDAISSLYFPFLIPLGFGLLVGSFFWIETINILLKKYYIPTFSSIIGFTLGSVFVLLPTFSFNIYLFFELFLFLFSFLLSYKLSKL